MTPKLLRCIGWLQRRALMAHSAGWAKCSAMAMALLKTTLKGCGGTSLLPPKDILGDCGGLLPVTSSVKVFVRTRRQPFAGTGAPKQRVTLTLHTSCRGWVRELTQQQLPTPSPPFAIKLCDV